MRPPPNSCWPPDLLQGLLSRAGWKAFGVSVALANTLGVERLTPATVAVAISPPLPSPCFWFGSGLRRSGKLACLTTIERLGSGDNEHEAFNWGLQCFKIAHFLSKHSQSSTSTLELLEIF